MANGNRRNSVTTSGVALGVRVDNLSDDVHGIQLEMRSMRTELFAAINSLASKQEAATTPNWQMYGVQVSVIVAIGAMAYWPINASTNDLKTTVATLAANVVSQKQYDADAALTRSDRAGLRADLSTVSQTYIQQQRYNTDMAKIAGEFHDLNESVVSRKEHEQRWIQFDALTVDLKKDIEIQVANLQRQVDALASKESQTYTTRDALLTSQQDMNRLRERLTELSGIIYRSLPQKGAPSP
jgi:hypothetical protein